MAAGINLSPDIPVILGQGFLFGLAYLIVKQWIMGPYYKLTARRHAVITGGDYDLKGVYLKIAERKKHIENATQDVYSRVQQLRAAKLNESLTQAKLAVAEAQESSDRELKAYVTELTQSLDKEMGNLEKIAEPLAGSLYQQWLKEDTVS